MDKKQSAIIRIIAWFIVAVALIVVLLFGLNGNLWNFNFFGFNLGYNFGYSYKDAGKYQAGGAEIDGKDVTDLDINWDDGSVLIEAYNGDTVKFYEDSSRNLSKNEKLHYYNQNGKLIIQYRKSEKKIFSMSGMSKNKHLTIKVPEDLAKSLGQVNVDTLDSQTTLTGLNADKILLDSIDGDFELTNCQAGQLDMDSVNGVLKGVSLVVTGKLDIDNVDGDAILDGSFGQIKCDIVSGNLTVTSQKCPKRIDAETIDGDITLSIPESSGFTYREFTVDGNFTCDFPLTHQKDQGVYGDGEAFFDFETVNGDVTIKKK